MLFWSLSQRHGYNPCSIALSEDAPKGTEAAAGG